MSLTVPPEVPFKETAPDDVRVATSPIDGACCYHKLSAGCLHTACGTRRVRPEAALAEGWGPCARCRP